MKTNVTIRILLAVALPFAVHYWNRANRLLRDPERYRLCTAVPVKMEANLFWHMIKLELEIYDGDRVVPGETGYIFTSSVMSSRYFGDYFGQRPVAELENILRDIPLREEDLREALIRLPAPVEEYIRGAAAEDIVHLIVQ